MKIFLPIIFALAFFASAFFTSQPAFAQSPTPNSTGIWVVDPETTFVGKNAARSGLMLDWTLQNYNWVCVNKIGDRQCDNSKNPLMKFWSQIVIFIVVPLLFLVVLVTAAVIIITRGRSLTIMRFIPRFIVVILLIVFSYSILQFLYQFTDLIQGFFLRTDITKDACPPACISQKDLLYVGWKYQTFVGLRLLGDVNAESAFISLLLTKLTALTYFVMVGVLLMRKIILWFFIIVSPIFPILLLYYPTRNTGKIWVGEFFRWLLYAPLFAIFLQGLVSLWRSKIPLVFANPQIGKADQIVFPTAVNILLGGPQQYVTPNNSVNLTETFALYVVALIMLWIVLLLPWILLQIFLDYASNYSPSDSAMMKTLVSMSANKPSPVPGAPGSPPSPQSGGATLSVPFAKKFNIPAALKLDYKPAGAAIPLAMGTQTGANTTALLSMAQMTSVPSIRDIAKFETAMLSKDQSQQSQLSQVKDSLAKIANPVAVASTAEREHYEQVHEHLSQESQKGNIVASNILSAANALSKKSAQTNAREIKKVFQQIANPTTATNIVDRTKFMRLHDAMEKESKENKNAVATSILSVSDKTSLSDVEQLQKKISEAAAAGHSMLGEIDSTVQSTQIKNVLKNVANPTGAEAADRTTLTKLKDTLTKASRQGNGLATSLLSVNETTSADEIAKLQEKIEAEKQKGVLFAEEISSLAKGEATASLPAMNRVQSVKQEDYHAVKDMWKENYRNMEIPQGMVGNRSAWIKEDMAKIDTIVGLLSATNADQVNSGMQMVSEILPFLLIGGFSQTEMILYMKAKKEAAKEVAEELAKEEESKVSVEAKKEAHEEQTMAASIEETNNDDDVNESPLTDVLSDEPTTADKPASVDQSTTSGTDDILAMLNLSVPSIRDIARYETLFFAKDQTQRTEVKQIHDVLQKVANPAIATDQADREHYEKLKAQLLSESTKGNMTAKLLLAAAYSASRSKATDIAKALQHAANPTLATTEEDRKRYEALHMTLTDASKQGNELATSILAVKETTAQTEIEALATKLRDAKDKGESVAQTVLATSEETTVLPQQNALQQVRHEDYDEVMKLWEENYRTLPVQAPFSDTSKGRIDWLKAETGQIQEIADLLNETDTQKRKEGMQKVSGILPFLLLGGFSHQEIVQYLTTKLEAAKHVLAELQKDESGKVSVNATNTKVEDQKQMEAQAEEEQK